MVTRRDLERSQTGLLGLTGTRLRVETVTTQDRPAEDQYSPTTVGEDGRSMSRVTTGLGLVGLED